MTGYSGTGKLGKKYHYYCCIGVKQKTCDKKIISKDLIESQVADVCAELLTPKRIRIIAEQVIAACQADGEYLSIKKIKAAIKETDEAIENLWIALEKGQSVDRITKRLEQREAEKKELEKQLAKEKRKQPSLQLTHILAFLDYLMELPGTSEVKKKSLINIFVHSVHLYDDYFYIIFNTGNTTLRSENIPLKSIENSLKQAVLKTFSGSDFDAFVPPNEKRTLKGCVFYLIGKKICPTDAILFFPQSEKNESRFPSAYFTNAKLSKIPKKFISVKRYSILLE
jgi:hypothetical protein